MAARALKTTGTALVTAPANLDALVPNVVKESAFGQLTGAALRAITLDWDDDDGKHRILAKVPLLNRAAALDPGGTMMPDIFRCCREKAFPRGSTIMTRSEPGLEMYFILEGEMGVHLDLDAPAVALLTPGDIVGEGALLSDEPRKAHIVAREDSLVLVLTKADLNTMISRYPALGKELAVFAEDREQALAATAGAKMERFVQAREDEKRQLLLKVRRLAGRITLGWFILAWGLVKLLWERVICGVIDGNRTAVDGSGSGILGEVETNLHSPCKDTAALAYQFMRIFMTVGPSLFAISDWDVDASSRLNPRKTRVGVFAWFFTEYFLLLLLGTPRRNWISFVEFAICVYFIVFSGPIIRQGQGTNYPKVSTILGCSFLGVPATWAWGIAFCSTPLMTEWCHGTDPRADQPLYVAWPGQGMIWLASVYGCVMVGWNSWRFRARVQRGDPTGAMKTLLASFCTAGQIGGLVSLGLLMNDFPNGDLQGQSFSSASNTAWQMLWGQGLLIGFGPMFWALAFRKQVFVWLHTIFESKQRVNDGAFIASLLETEDTTSSDIMRNAQKLLRRIKWENISRDLLATSSGSEATYALSEDCALGEIDFFISHSWSDDATLKYDKLQQVTDEFEAENGRLPTFWLDKVCIDQSNISDALRCLPVFEMACQKLLVLNGQTYTTRLWCVWELYTFFAINVDMDRMQVEILSEGDNVNGLSSFDVKDAHCYDPGDEQRLRAVIDAGGASTFNELIRDLGKKMGAEGLRMTQNVKVQNPLSVE